MDIQLHITMQRPPAGIDFAIQKGSGSRYETIQTQRSTGEDMRFNFSIALKSDTQKTSPPRFAGPFVQGKPLEQFIYIDMGLYAGQTDSEYNGRIKVPLKSIGWDTIAQLERDATAILSTSFPGTGKDGGPIYATVKDFKGWEISRPN
jgi:hypothetical protein